MNPFLVFTLISSIVLYNAPQIPTAPVPVGESNIPEHHLSQWQGNCPNNCNYDKAYYCQREGKPWCMECGLYCNKDSLLKNDAECRGKCPALYDFLHPPTTTEVPPTTTEIPTVVTTWATPRGATPSSTPSSSTSPASSTSPSVSNLDQQLHWIQDNWRWLLGAIIFLFIAIIVIMVIIKCREKICPLTKPQQAMGDPNNERAPAILRGERVGLQPMHPGDGQEADDPLMNATNSVDSGVNGSIARSSQTQSTHF